MSLISPIKGPAAETKIPCRAQTDSTSSITPFSAATLKTAQTSLSLASQSSTTTPTTAAPIATRQISSPSESKISQQTSETYQSNLAKVVDSVQIELLKTLSKKSCEELKRKEWIGNSRFHKGFCVLQCKGTMLPKAVRKMKEIWQAHREARVYGGHTVHFLYSSEGVKVTPLLLDLAKKGHCTLMSGETPVQERVALGLVNSNIQNLHAYVVFRQVIWKLHISKTTKAYIETHHYLADVVATIHNPAGKDIWLRMIAALETKPDCANLIEELKIAIDEPSTFLMVQGLSPDQLEHMAQTLMEIVAADFEKEEKALADILKILSTTSLSSPIKEINERSAQFEATWLEVYRKQMVNNFSKHLLTANFPVDRLPIFCHFSLQDRDMFHILLNSQKS